MRASLRQHAAASASIALSSRALVDLHAAASLSDAALRKDLFVTRQVASVSLSEAAAVRFGLPQFFVHEAESVSVGTRITEIRVQHVALSSAVPIHLHFETIVSTVAPVAPPRVLGRRTRVRAYASPRAVVGSEGDYGGNRHAIAYNTGGARVIPSLARSGEAVWSSVIADLADTRIEEVSP